MSRRTFLVTGFAAFPGMPRNPTQRVVAQLRRHAPRLARFGIDLHCAVLPVRYDGLQAKLDALAFAHQPDVVLHFGVAGRRRRICVEMQARNRVSPLRPDADGRCPAADAIAKGPSLLRSTFAGYRIVSALRGAGLHGVLSRDAGDYLCNATLYRSLFMGLAPTVGFIHVPRPSGLRSPGCNPRCGARTKVLQRSLSPDDLSRGALLAVLAVAPRSSERCGVPATLR